MRESAEKPVASTPRLPHVNSARQVEPLSYQDRLHHAEDGVRDNRYHRCGDPHCRARHPQPASRRPPHSRTCGPARCSPPNRLSPLTSSLRTLPMQARRDGCIHAVRSMGDERPSGRMPAPNTMATGRGSGRRQVHLHQPVIPPLHPPPDAQGDSAGEQQYGDSNHEDSFHGRRGLSVPFLQTPSRRVRGLSYHIVGEGPPLRRRWQRIRHAGLWRHGG